MQDYMVEYYLHKRENNEISLFIKNKKDFKEKKLKPSADQNVIMNYLTGASKNIKHINFYSNISLSEENLDRLKGLPNIFYKYDTQHPDSMKEGVNEHYKLKSLPLSTTIEANVVDKDNYSFIAITIRTNEKKSSSIKILRNKTNIPYKIFNSLKDIIDKFVQEGTPVSFKSSIPAVKCYFDHELENVNIKNKIKEVLIESFEQKVFIEKNEERLNNLIKNHEKDMEIKNEVIADYAAPVNKNKIVIYTDASAYIDSKNNINSSGFGIVVKQDGCEEIMFKVSKKLPDQKTLFDSGISEGIAIYYAINFLMEQNIIDNKTELEIRSDSLSNVRKLNRLEKSTHRYTKKIFDLLSENIPETKIMFKWVKGHSTNDYNIEADILAEQSIKNPDSSPVIEKNEKALIFFRNRNRNRRDKRLSLM